MSLLSEKVLVLNRNWQAIRVISAQRALRLMIKPRTKNPELYAASALQFENGELIGPVPWDEWIKLPIRKGDKIIQAPKLSIRMPSIILLGEFGDIPEVEPHFNKRGLWHRQKGKDLWTGEDLHWESCNIDHVIPKCRGGKTTWENCGLTDKKLNQQKGDKLPSELGWTPKVALKRPEKVIVAKALQEDEGHPEWDMFLGKVKKVV